MNKRIQELAEQAKKLADEETKAFTNDTGQRQVIWNKVYDQTFAELIIEKCVDTLKIKGETYGAYLIEKHFGVE